MPRIDILELLANAGVRLWDQRWRVTGVLACGASPGYAWWMLRHGDQLERLAGNRLPKGAATQMLIPVLVSLAIAVIAILVVHLRRRDRARPLNKNINL